MRIQVHNRQRKIRIDLGALRAFAANALGEVLGLMRERSALASLPSVDVYLVSDRTIAELHRRFMQIAGPTDVITFQHGEIFISPETTRRNARRFAIDAATELERCLLHGLLHLHGYDDSTSAAARMMERVQEQLLARLRI
jgi:probable rRNA maturation factor